MNKNNLFQICEETIQKGGNFQPILLTSPQSKTLEIELFDVIEKIFTRFEVDRHHIHILKDDGESIKIEGVRKFIQQSNLRSSGRFQIFVIENISRLTLQSSNASLKFLEEPGDGNVIFLTNHSTSGVIETILSRVRHIELSGENRVEKDMFYYDLIDESITKQSPNLYVYFFQDKKLEKPDYIKFFTTLLQYIQEKQVKTHLLDEVEQSLNLLHQTAVLPKYLVDRILIGLQK